MPLKIIHDARDSGRLVVHFSTVLHTRGTDFTCYKNTPAWEPTLGTDHALESAEDSAVLKSVLEALLLQDAGVEKVNITPYIMVVHHSRAVDAEDIMARVVGAARDAGVEVDWATEPQPTGAE